ncbi:MAG: patatin-like phospholipase family protein [Nitrospirota bacterium]
MASLGLALGGGGVRGFAHLGVLRVLEREGLAPRAIAGTSMGAIVAALYALLPTIDAVEGTLGEFFKRFAPTLTQLAVRAASSPGGIALDEPSLLAPTVFHRHFDQLIPDTTFERARVPLAVVAVDLVSGEEVVYTTGPVRPAVLGSAALPGVFPPIAFDGRVLVDGGWTSRIPVDAARQLGAERVVAIEVSDDADAVFPPNQPHSGLRIVLRAAEITRNHLARLSAQRADLLLVPPTGDVALHDVSRVADCVRLGVEAAQARLGEIRALVAGRSA